MERRHGAAICDGCQTLLLPTQDDYELYYCAVCRHSVYLCAECSHLWICSCCGSGRGLSVYERLAERCSRGLRYGQYYGPA